MLMLLPDEHISPAIATGLTSRHHSLTVHFMAEWEGGQFLGARRCSMSGACRRARINPRHLRLEDHSTSP